MKRNIFLIFVTVTLGISLAACNQGKEEPPTSETIMDTVVSSSEVEDTSDSAIEGDKSASDTEVIEPTQVAEPNEEFDPPVNEVHQEGGYAHDLGGGCVIYTENDLNMFIHDGVFDFYEMMDYFGATGRMNDVGIGKIYCGIHNDDAPYYSVNLCGGSSSPHRGMISVDLGARIFFDVDFYIGNSNNFLPMSDGNKVSYELAAVLLLEMEMLDEYGDSMPYKIMDLGLPETFVISLID